MNWLKRHADEVLLISLAAALVLFVLLMTLTAEAAGAALAVQGTDGRLVVIEPSTSGVVLVGNRPPFSTQVCPRCARDHVRSVVFIDGVSTTFAGITAWYDTAGFLHLVDPNLTRARFHCSNGHSWEETW